LVLGGTVTMRHSTISDNGADQGGGIQNGAFANVGGTVWILTSTVRNNGANNAGGIANHALLFLENSTLQGNVCQAFAGQAAGMTNAGTATVTNSTIGQNQGQLRCSGGIANYGTLTLRNSTVSQNRAGGLPGTRAGGILAVSGIVTLHNTILAQNTAPVGPECVGVLGSLGHNLLGDLTACSLTLEDTDLTGDPGLDAFADNDTPGHGYFPLLPTSPAIDAADDLGCPRRDQRGQRRVDIRGVGASLCDIGAIEFPPHGEPPTEEAD
jgi:hypothetical protein